jgi:hypothetical protein
MSNTGTIRFFEMATDSILYHMFQFFKGVSLSENRMPQRARFVATFRRFFNDEDNFRFA